MRNVLIGLCAMFACGISCAGEPETISAGTLSPGLNATYRSLADQSTLFRIDSKPALALGNTSPHPHIPPGLFSVVWSGIIALRGDGPFSFHAYLGGELTVKIDDVVVLTGRGETEGAQISSTEPLQRPAGRYRISAEYRSMAGVPARLQIWWEGAGFPREPLPSWVLKHAPQELPETAQQESAAAGRLAAGQFGCARCHVDAFPAVNDPPPGPSLAGIGMRVSREWLFTFLNDPAKASLSARMPALFKADREGLVERWIIAEFLHNEGAKEKPLETPARSDHRRGRGSFLSIGCVACHFAPDIKREEQKDLGRIELQGLADRLPAAHLVEFLKNPATRYPDERHPVFPVSPDLARDIAAYLLLWSKPSITPAPPDQPVTVEEIEQAARRLGVSGLDAAAKALLRSKGCTSCHAGVGETNTLKIPFTSEPRASASGCLSETGTVRFNLNAQTKAEIAAYTALAARERHPSPAEERRQLLRRAGCFRCHSTDEHPSPLEEASSSIGGSLLEIVPFLRTPRLNNASLKYIRPYLTTSIRDGVAGVRFRGYSYRMPRYGHQTESIIQALAEMDGDLVADPPPEKPSDPTLSGPGAALAGFEGYSCVSCHTWNGKKLSDADPGTIAPDLASITQRIRRDWFERWMDDPGRIVPGTVMPQIFQKGQPAAIRTVLDGDAARQKEAMWAYLSLGKDAPSPKPLAPVPVDFPAADAPPMVAQIPIRLSDNKNVESICIAYGTHDLLLYDVGALKLRGVYSGAQILRAVRGRIRTYTLDGKLQPDFAPAAAANSLEPKPQSVEFLGYDRLADGARILLRAHFADRVTDGSETIWLAGRKLNHEIHWPGTPTGKFSYELAPPAAPPEAKHSLVPDPGPVGGSLERPGYRAIAYPRPKTITGEDLVMPGAVAAHPGDGRVFIASMKNGELFVLRDPTDDGKSAYFENYAGGLFQEAYSMLAEKDGLYVLHRRNLTKIRETGGIANRFERVFALPHGIAENYDYGYGLARDKTGAFIFSFAPYADRKMAGAGSALRLVPGEIPEEIAFGFRNPLGWCAGPDSEIFYTDNQGEWIAANKLCHIVKGRYYGFPTPDQKTHAAKPFARTTLWVPYAWARSINGVTYNTSIKFGPFKGQFFLAELMYGGAIIRASLEKVNGEYQGACFPFWGKGLLGPVTLAFDPRGRLFVGGITEPGWMAQPDRGALFRIDFTGQTPFEIQAINARPRGFRLNFTQPVDTGTAAAASYSVEHFRYEYTGAYGSPELDRTPLAVETATVASNGRSVELQTGALVKDRVYMISASGVKSEKGETLVNPTGAYTLNEIPQK